MTNEEPEASAPMRSRLAVDREQFAQLRNLFDIKKLKPSADPLVSPPFQGRDTESVEHPIPCPISAPSPQSVLDFPKFLLCWHLDLWMESQRTSRPYMKGGFSSTFGDRSG